MCAFYIHCSNCEICLIITLVAIFIPYTLADMSATLWSITISVYHKHKRSTMSWTYANFWVVFCCYLHFVHACCTFWLYWHNYSNETKSMRSTLRAALPMIDDSQMYSSRASESSIRKLTNAYNNKDSVLFLWCMQCSIYIIASIDSPAIFHQRYCCIITY